MPEETAPTDTTTPAASKSPSGVLGALGCGCAALVGVVLVLVVLLAYGSAGSTDFPRVAPEDMASRAFQSSQEAYDVLGFKRTVEPGVERVGVSTENTFSSGYCYDGGLLGMDDKTVDGAYRMSHSWALDHVPASRAVPGLRRLQQHLKDNGWTVTSYREGGKGKDWDLYVQRDDGDERMSFTWFPDRDYFIGGASVPCAYDPEWKDGDIGPSGDDQTPPALGPSQRGRMPRA
ncbi:hypothetical protein AQI88_30600 [Streptomyces cellostaticus]|uniref:Uncharacterized protein n=1 Tax=Streptomyces cellostaticus TaxID=67285 RepID=A0A101NGV3_9ACTN|nr:hypothetical protein [Streptomyces cellostaticus]KUM92732.1 hypothetical protein AQI88_30600 [Streptomyces cellostaticus]GHI06660.1 hypothetical protein Scel_49810 [Streptomyces cellostaticus]